MNKLYMRPSLELVEFTLTDVILYSPTPVEDPSQNELPILTRMKDDLAGDGLPNVPQTE